MTIKDCVGFIAEKIGLAPDHQARTDEGHAAYPVPHGELLTKLPAPDASASATSSEIRKYNISC